MTKILLKLSDEQVSKPIISEIVLNLKVPLNILHANVTAEGGEILAEVPLKDTRKVIHALKKNNIDFKIQKGIIVDLEKCIDCGACYSLCPVNAISFKTNHMMAFNEEMCISCGLCIDACPMRALTI